MSWHYLQGQEEASWEDICLDGACIDFILHDMITPCKNIVQNASKISR